MKCDFAKFTSTFLYLRLTFLSFDIFTSASTDNEASPSLCNTLGYISCKMHEKWQSSTQSRLLFKLTLEFIQG